jgi:magnesium transporter
MVSLSKQTYYIEKLSLLIEHENKQDLAFRVAEIENTLNSEQIAILLEAFPIDERLIIWAIFNADTQQQIFLEMRIESREMILDACDDEQCFPLFEKLDAHELLDICEDLSDRFVHYAISKMTAKQRALYKEAQEYSIDEVGHWQSFDDLQVPSRLKISSIRKICSKKLPPLSEVFYVTNTDSFLLGEVPISKIMSISSHDEQAIKELIRGDFQALYVNEDIYQGAEKVIASGRAALPVIDSAGCLTGRLDLTTAYEVKDQQTDIHILKSGGLTEEEDLFSNVWMSSKKRALWLGVNLITAFLASWFIGLYEGTLQQVVALAVLMPIVASMGGISGSQTLTLIIRGLALGQITEANKRQIVLKEFKVGVINGFLWASIIALITYLWFASSLLSLAIFIAILGNIMIASLSGVWVPWILTKLKIDPALSGSVLLTTVTDVFGFIAFLGLGTLFLT